MRVEAAWFETRLRALLTTGAFAVLLALAVPASADPVRVEASSEGERGRLIMTWPAPVGLHSEVRDGRLILRLDRPVDGDFSAAGKLPTFVGVPQLDESRRTVSFPLRPGVGGLAYANNSSVIIEFIRQASNASEDGSARAQPAAAEPSSVSKVRVQTGQHRGFSRVLFEWDQPVGYRLERTAEGLAIEFDRPAEIDARNFARRYLKYVHGGESQSGDGGTRVALRISAQSEVRDRREGRNIILDVLAPVAGQPSPEQTAESPVTSTTPPISTGPSGDAPTPVSPTGPPEATAVPREQAQVETVPAETVAAEAPPELPAPSSPQAPHSSQAQASEGEALRIDWDRPVAAVVFRRGNALWAVFDQPSQRDTEALTRSAPGAIRRVDQRPHDLATILRIEADPDTRTLIERDGLAWVLRFGGSQPASHAPITPVVAKEGGGGSRVLLPVAQPGEPLALDDPAEGETVVVVPVIPQAAHIDRAWSYPQFRLAHTLQGIVVQPRIDTLRVRALADGVEISSSDGLAVSPGVGGGEGARRDRLLDTGDWGPAGGSRFIAQRQALERAIVDASAAEREPVRLRLAQFLLGRAFAVEAVGALQVAEQQRPELAEEPRFLLLRGAAQLIAGRLAQANDDLERAHAKSPGHETALWKAAALTAGGEPVDEAALTSLAAWTEIAESYPPQLRLPVAALLAEAAITGGRTSDGRRLIELGRQAAKSAEARSRFTFLEARSKERAGDIDGAIAAYEEAARLDPRRARYRRNLPGPDSSCVRTASLPPKRWPRWMDCAMRGVAMRWNRNCFASWVACNSRPVIIQPACEH